MAIFEAKLMELDKPNINGRVYTTKCIKEALEDPCLKEQLANKCCFVYREGGVGSYMGRDCTKICGAVENLTIRDGALYATINNLEEYDLRQKIDKQCSFSIVGYGDLKYDPNTDTNIVEKYTMDAVCLVPNKE